MAQVEAAVAEEIALLFKEGVTDADLQRAKTSLLAEDIYAQDDLFNQAYRLGTWLMAGGTQASFDTWLDDIKQVTTADVQRVAQKYLQPKRATTGVLVKDKEQLS